MLSTIIKLILYWIEYINAYYLKMKPRTFLKLYVCFCISLHIVGLRWVPKLLKGIKGMADYNPLYVL